MARINVPTVKCDRCGLTTSDTQEMFKFQKLASDGRDMGFPITYDLCPACSEDFKKFIANKENVLYRVPKELDPMGLLQIKD